MKCPTIKPWPADADRGSHGGEHLGAWREERKPFSLGRSVCTGETYKAVVKLTFAKGAALEDPKGLIHSSLEGNVRRAINLREDEVVNAAAFKALIKAAVKLNVAGKTKKKAR